MDEFVVDVRNVTKRYVKYDRPLDRLLVYFWEKVFGKKNDKLKNVHAALSNVSLQLRKGECIGVLGMNGAGKSTLLQIIAQTLEPTEGSVRTKGRIAALLELGSGFNPEFTGRENVRLNAKILGLSQFEIEERIEDVLAFAEIDEFVDQPLKTYSSGMVIRLAFSVLTQIRPSVFIIDEALSVGDAYFGHKSANFIRNFKENGGTLLFCSHNLDAIRTLCSTAILLEGGRVAMRGDVEQVVDYYSAVISKKWDDFEVKQYRSETGKYVTRSGSGKAQIASLRVEDQNGDKCGIFKRMDHCRVRIQMEATEDISNLTLGIRFADRIGSTVFGTNSYHMNSPIQDCAAGDILEAVFDAKLNLGPGEYSITVAVHSEDTHLSENFDWIDNMGHFKVIRKEGDAFSDGTGYLDMTLSINRLEHSN